MTYHPDAGTVDILVLEASNLRKQDFIGLPSELMVQVICYIISNMKFDLGGPNPCKPHANGPPGHAKKPPCDHRRFLGIWHT